MLLLSWCLFCLSDHVDSAFWLLWMIVPIWTVFALLSAPDWLLCMMITRNYICFMVERVWKLFFQVWQRVCPTEWWIWCWTPDLIEFSASEIGTPVNRIPIMAKQVLDLYELYKLVVSRGGLVEVINKKIWREITKGLNLPSSITSAAFTLRTQSVP